MRRAGCIISLLLFFCAHGAYGATPPAQAPSGPGGSGYAHASVRKHEYGTGATRYWVYEPDDPLPKSAPLVIFNHGWGAINPKTYGAWIEHIVRRGNIVIYPVYQDGLRTPVADFLKNAVKAVKDALIVLQEDGHVQSMVDKCAVVGHSMGGVIAADMAAVAAREGIPQPKAVMCVQPGKTWAKSERVSYHLQDLRSIPAETLLLSLSGDADALAKDIDARRIYDESERVPKENKDYIIVVSDSRGTPPLKASHFSPVAPDQKFDSGERIGSSDEKSGGSRGIRVRIKERLKERMEDAQAIIGDSGGKIDALDYYGYWKLFDALCDVAFYGKHREYALGNTSPQRFMGRWSDGVPVKELVVIERP